MIMQELFDKITQQSIIRFIISGCIATVVNLAILYVLTDIFGIWYLISAVVSFLAAFFVSFSLQKFWTFGDRDTNQLHLQAVKYFIFSSINLVLNTIMIYIFTDFFGIWYILSQIFTAAIIAIESFIIYRFVIFKTLTIKNAITSL